MNTELPPCLLVILGASGDLAKRLLIPAIYNLVVAESLPKDFWLLCVAQEDWNDDAMRSHVTESLDKYWGDKPVKSKVDWITQRTFYERADLKQAEAYRKLALRIQELQHSAPDQQSNVLFYLALAPAMIAPVSCNLSESHLFEEQQGQWRRLIIEKPFGHDLESAIQLTKELKKYLPEEQIYRIDHFSGKEAAHDIAVVRFSNTFIDALWNRSTVDNVQITIAESGGIEARGAFYEKSGALRDMVPNHMAELLSIAAMERPISREPDAVRDQQVKLLKAVKRVPPEHCVRGQYAEGSIKGKTVPAYLKEKDVAPGSNVETYVAMKLEIDNYRWAGVPFYLRTGKRLASDVTEVVLEFKQTDENLFEPSAGKARHALVFRLKPDNGIHMEFSAKEAGMETRPVPAEMVFAAPLGPFGDHGNGYERLLLDAMKGTKTLFQREDFVEEGWRIVGELLTRDPGKPVQYAAGTQGPEAADKLTAQNGHAWRTL